MDKGKKPSVLEELCIMKFCEKYEVSLISIDVTTENGSPELAYCFDDGLGFYTIDAIRKSIQQEKIGVSPKRSHSEFYGEFSYN